MTQQTLARSVYDRKLPDGSSRSDGKKLSKDLAKAKKSLARNEANLADVEGQINRAIDLLACQQVALDKMADRIQQSNAAMRAASAQLDEAAERIRGAINALEAEDREAALHLLEGYFADADADRPSGQAVH